MKKLIVFGLIVLFASSSVALAVGNKKTLEFTKSAMGTVVFDGTVHKEAGLKCKECHNNYHGRDLCRQAMRRLPQRPTCF